MSSRLAKKQKAENRIFWTSEIISRLLTVGPPGLGVPLPADVERLVSLLPSLPGPQDLWAAFPFTGQLSGLSKVASQNGYGAQNGSASVPKGSGPSLGSHFSNK